MSSSLSELLCSSKGGSERRRRRNMAMKIAPSTIAPSGSVPSSWACATSRKKVADAFRRLLPLFAAFFAIEAGTNNAERGLGRHSRHRKAHQGPRETATSWSEVTFEVHEDGPEHEREIAIPPVAESSGDLQMTDFSRRCTILWRAVHGRRFCSYTPREKEKKEKKQKQVGGCLGP